MFCFIGVIQPFMKKKRCILERQEINIKKHILNLKDIKKKLNA